MNIKVDKVSSCSHEDSFLSLTCWRSLHVHLSCINRFPWKLISHPQRRSLLVCAAVLTGVLHLQKVAAQAAYCHEDLLGFYCTFSDIKHHEHSYPNKKEEALNQ